METLRKYITIIITLFYCTLSYSQTKNKDYVLYIENHFEIAQKQQKTHRIPSSIILAQGLLESGAGRSSLAIDAHNHFGIKCHDWTGDAVYKDDDARNECFRKYKHVYESYEDHSAFLVNRKRYASLFNLDPTDYAGWAHGLKKAGYATDPSYAYKLISIIDDYELHQYDLGKAAKKSRKIKKRDDKSNTNKSKPGTVSSDMGSVNGAMIHEVYQNNGIHCIIASQGDTYGSIADEFNLNEKKLRRYNDVSSTAQLENGDWIYLRSKKNKAAKKYHTHTVQPGESMYQIAQFYGVKLTCLYKLNDIPYTQGAQVNQVLKLR